MSDMANEGIPETVYRRIEAQRLAAPKSGVKVGHSLTYIYS